MSGILLTNEREYIIIALLIYLICNTEKKNLQIIGFILLITHIYKLYYNYQINKEIYKDKKTIIYNLILFISLLLLIFYPNNTNYVFLFSVLYVITSILTHKVLINNSNYKLNQSKTIIPHEVTILIFSIIIILYSDYKFKYLLWAELIDHILTLMLF
tara:strand:+ start:7984 stop:8457 length:474 start_codon:yes stop_codon:yes gene_type:complete